jgi:hypothetical protein
MDMDMLETAFDVSTYSRNRDRLMKHDVAAAFFAAVRDQATDLMSREHFSVDGTLIEAWASLKSFRPKDEECDDHDNNGWGGFRGERRRNETHESKTDPGARLMRKGNGQPAKLSYMGHALVENRNGLLVDLRVSTATGKAEREVASEMLEIVTQRDLLGELCATTSDTRLARGCVCNRSRSQCLLSPGMIDSRDHDRVGVLGAHVNGGAPGAPTPGARAVAQRLRSSTYGFGLHSAPARAPSQREHLFEHDPGVVRPGAAVFAFSREAAVQDDDGSSRSMSSSTAPRM